MAELMHHCLEIGITTFDHADIYGDYTNEGDFGLAFLQTGISRESVQLISKCGIQFDAKGRKNRVKHYDCSAGYITWSVERSLPMLRTDYLDMILLHRPSALMHPEEIGDAIMKLKAQGKIKAFGVSNFTASQIALLETVIPVQCNQVEFSLTQNPVMHDGTLDDCMINKRIVMSWSPLGSVFREHSKTSDGIKNALAPMLKKYGATADELLLAWIMRHPSTVHPVVGTTAKNRLSGAMKATRIDLDLQDWFILLEAANGYETA